MVPGTNVGTSATPAPPAVATLRSFRTIGLAGPTATQQPRRRFEEVVPQPHDEELGRQWLPVFQAGQASWQRPHSVHVSGVEQLFPAQVLDVPGPENRVLRDVLHIHRPACC